MDKQALRDLAARAHIDLGIADKLIEQCYELCQPEQAPGAALIQLARAKHTDPCLRSAFGKAGHSRQTFQRALDGDFVFTVSPVMEADLEAFILMPIRPCQWSVSDMKHILWKNEDWANGRPTKEDDEDTWF